MSGGVGDQLKVEVDEEAGRTVIRDSEGRVVEILDADGLSTVTDRFDEPEPESRY